MLIIYYSIIADVDSSLALFRELHQTDPYRLDNWDVYSHLLYLKDKRMELANLAQKAVSIDKYRVETCCVIGKFRIAIQIIILKINLCESKANSSFFGEVTVIFILF